MINSSNDIVTTIKTMQIVEIILKFVIPIISFLIIILMNMKIDNLFTKIEELDKKMSKEEPK